MQRGSRHVLPRLTTPIDIRFASVATKPAPLPTRNSHTPPTLSTDRSAPNLGKWGRPQGLPQRLPGASFSPASEASGSMGRYSRDLASDSAQASDGKRRSRPEAFGVAPSGHSKWKKPIPFPMPSRRPESSPRPTVRDSAPHLANSAARGLPHLGSATQSRIDPRDHSLRAETVHAPSEDLESEALPSDQVRGDLAYNKPRRSKVTHKERGSLRLAYGDFEPSSRNRSRDKVMKPPGSNAKLKNKPKALNQTKREVFIPSIVSVGNLARILRVSLSRLQRKMREAGMGEEASYDHVLTAEYAVLLAEEFNYKPVVNDEAAFDLYPSLPTDPSTLPLRPPIVTIMGHVDHGKTTLLDTLRSTSVAKGEAGGITQHIGAFSVPVPNSVGGGLQQITFLDTPGHAAFSAMRARGADVTDIVVLVVAADDGVRPQTKEVIQLIQRDSDVQLIVAINKVDKHGVDINKVHNALLAEGIQLEAMGGDVPSVEISGLTGKGLDQLVETITAVAEMQDLRADSKGQAYGRIIESKLQKGLGNVATVLLLSGSLKPGAHLIAGTTHAKLRVMTDSTGSQIKVAGPGMAVTVSGWKELPGAGDEVLDGSEQDVKKAVANRKRKAEEQAMMVDIDAINVQRRLDREQREREEGDQPEVTSETEKKPHELRLVIKADVSGSVEALEGALKCIGNENARAKIVFTGVGEITESDILLAKTSESTIIAFAVPVPRSAVAAAAAQSIPIVSSKIIYQVIEDVRQRVANLLPTVYEKRVSGEAAVLQIFDIKLTGGRTKTIAGCRVTKGIVEKSKKVQVVRNGEVVHEGRLDTFRRLKDDITEASKGTECGISLETFGDLKKDDVIQVYSDIELPKVL
ncbi:translation initiation factor IF-2 [Lactarius deliciosus]|nr:translation initiation factor IF-2 [Lactarius deliciosus]